ncbi:unnamed protein product [Cuscuta campestris]|uniref:Integrase catalytic domain-containing protein n=1 Tax=Cuscuta campestris TaxID=132261 RepID=A0A484K946_9ASTE|nr:unnamed protein product [Cuscuta campestris]
MSSSNHNTVSSQAASESTPAIPLMMTSMGTTIVPITTVGSIGMIPITSTPTPSPTTTMFPGSITTPGGAFTPYPSAWAQFAADPANAQALQGYQQMMAMMQQAGGVMPFSYPGMTPPIMPPPVSTPSTFVPRMVPIRPVNLTGTMNEATPSNVHEVDETEQEAARRRKGKAIAKPSKTRDSAFKRLGDKEDGPRKPAKLRLGPEMGRTSAMERLAGVPRASAYTRLSYDEDDLDKIGSIARKLRVEKLTRKIKLDRKKFTGKEDPNVHLDTFHNAAHMAGCTNAEECLLFFSSLRGRQVEWFNGLPHGKIGSFKKLAEVFRKKYQGNCIKRKKFTYLNTVGQKEKESLTQFLTRWRDEVDKAEVLNKSKRELEEGYTKVKSDKPKKDDQTGGSKPKATYDGSVHEIRDEKKGEQPKRPWTEKWCTYHQSVSHNTADCRNVKAVLKEMALRGELGKGSSVNVLYLDAFKKLKLDRSMLRPLQTPLSGFTGASIEAEGQITLPVTLGTGNRTVTKQMRFVVVDIKCVHNVILGRPGINQVDKGEEKDRIELDANTEVIQIDASNPERKVKIGADLQEELRTEIVQVLTSLVVGHINGNMEAKGEKMQRYRDLARALLKNLTEYVMEQIPRGENTDADLLSKLTQAAPEHVSKLAKIETLEKVSIDGFSDSMIEEDGQPNPDLVEPDDIWMDDLVRYYMTGQFPDDEDRVKKVKLRAPRFQMLDGRLYKREFCGPFLSCLTRPATYYHPVSNVIPFGRFGMDIIGAFPQAQGRKKYVMIAIDYFTKWVEAEAYATITTKQCQRFMWKNIITRFGSPRNIVTDNGPQFRNPGFSKYLEDFGITHNKASVAYPQGRGQVENANRTIVDGIKKRLDEAGTNWLEELPHIIWAYRVTSRRATGETPFVLTYGCEARLPIEAKIMTFREKIYEEKGNEEDHLAELNFLKERRMVVEAKMIEYQQAAKAYHDNRVGPHYFQVGDEVLRRREASKLGDGGKLAKKWEGPYRVTAVLRPGTYKLETMEGRELERCWNSHHLRKFYR